MCDYSLEHLASRPAKVGDKLVSTKFTNSITRGFTAIGEPNVAVCLMPGTELAFEQDVTCVHALGLLPSRRIAERVARFREVNKQNPHDHHDALEFPSGQIVLVTRLCSCRSTSTRKRPASRRPTRRRVRSPDRAAYVSKRGPPGDRRPSLC
jgi:hypothetical protein